MATHGGISICRYRHWEIGPLIPHGGLKFCWKASTQLNNPYLYTFACSCSWTVCTECSIRCPAWPATFCEIRPPHYVLAIALMQSSQAFPKCMRYNYSVQRLHISLCCVSSSSAWKCAIIERVKKNPLGKANYCMQILLCVIKEGTI